MLCATVLIAGCGSSGSSDTVTVGNENSADNSLINSGESKATKTTAAATTPTSGPLSKEPTVTPPSGPPPTKLETKELIVGTGAEAKAGDSVTVNYVGVLYKNGKKFNASWETQQPFTFTLGKGQVIKGWDQGIPGMKVGGRRELIIPAAARLRRRRLTADDPGERSARIRRRSAGRLGELTAFARCAALTLLAGAALVVAGCGSGVHATAPKSRLQREDLVVVAHALAAQEPAVENEVQATKAAWPLLIDGLPADTRKLPRGPLRVASERASALPCRACSKKATAPR